MRPCERQCRTCKLWKHHSRFRQRQRPTPHGTVWEFDPDCRDCQQKIRNEQKNTDRPLAIIRQRAATIARRSGESTEFALTQLNYAALVPVLRALMTPEGLCQSCGHQFLNERDIQIEHLEPPRHQRDFARLHARNIRLGCGSCNRTKGSKPYAVWLDEQEGARLSNLAGRQSPAGPSPDQGELFQA